MGTTRRHFTGEFKREAVGLPATAAGPRARLPESWGLPSADGELLRQPETELVHEACYKTRDAAQHDLFAYIEGYYNRQRLHSALGYITPEQAERRAARSGVHQIEGRSGASCRAGWTAMSPG